MLPGAATFYLVIVDTPSDASSLLFLQTATFVGGGPAWAKFSYRGFAILVFVGP